MLKALRAWLSRRHTAGVRSSAVAITYDALGFTVGLGVPPSQPPGARVLWSEVQKVGVFKRDQFVVDLLCLVVELPGPSTVELNEEMQGWQAFVEALPLFLAGTKPFHEWFMEVAFPAFATRPTLIFSREGSGAAEP
jgi:hypothetical protein